MKKVLGLIVVVALSLVCYVGGSGYAAAPGDSITPSTVRTSEVPAVQQTQPYWPVFNPAPVRSVAAVAPYEVNVQYTPIEPQPGECTYCTCLPYGCPDGSPVINCGGCGGCSSCCVTAPKIFTPVLSTVGNILDGATGLGLCVIDASLQGGCSTLKNVLCCFNARGNTTLIQ